MTVESYIRQKLQAWKITEAQMADIVALGIDETEEYTLENKNAVQSALADVLEELALSPYMKNISENGFSVSWDYQNMGRYYLWLCNKLGKKPDSNVVSALGISTITDKTDIW